MNPVIKPYYRDGFGSKSIGEPQWRPHPRNVLSVTDRLDNTARWVTGGTFTPIWNSSFHFPYIFHNMLWKNGWRSRSGFRGFLTSLLPMTSCGDESIDSHNLPTWRCYTKVRRSFVARVLFNDYTIAMMLGSRRYTHNQGGPPGGGRGWGGAGVIGLHHGKRVWEGLHGEGSIGRVYTWVIVKLEHNGW